MLKHFEIANRDSCLNKARLTELIFVLLERDAAAPVAVRAWVAERIRLGKNKPDDDQILEALNWAKEVEASQAKWRAEEPLLPFHEKFTNNE